MSVHLCTTRINSSSWWVNLLFIVRIKSELYMYERCTNSVFWPVFLKSNASIIMLNHFWSGWRCFLIALTIFRSDSEFPWFAWSTVVARVQCDNTGNNRFLPTITFRRDIFDVCENKYCRMNSTWSFTDCWFLEPDTSINLHSRNSYSRIVRFWSSVVIVASCRKWKI